MDHPAHAAVHSAGLGLRLALAGGEVLHALG